MTTGFRFDTEFERQAARTPAAVALRSPDGTITYAALDDRANRVAHHLRSAGIPSGAFVGLHMERSIDGVAALLGILKADAAVVPLPPSWPAERIAEIVRFARLDAVVDSAATPLAAPQTRTIRMADALAGEPTVPPPRGGGDRPAFVICSSGSTGTPKMIVRSHESFLHRLRWTWDQHPYAAGEVCVQKSFAATTHAVYELFEPLLRGVAVRLVPDEALRDLATFWDLLAAERVTRLLIVPSLLQASLDIPGFVAPPLRVLVLMGERVPAELATRVTAAFPPPTRVFSIYGSSEASSTLVSDLRAPRAPEDDPPLGHPIAPAVRTVVRDGMLYVAGSPLFVEYFRDPAATAAVLETAPGSEPLYRTGDQVRVREDGSLLFAGRIDDVVKVRGYRVDLGDVERVLSRAPGVGQAVVVPHPDAASAATLVGFVTPADVATATLFEWLASRLPGYMVPSTMVPVDAFPRTPSGKIDRRRLVEMHRQRTSDAHVRYESDTERVIADVWGRLLRAGTVPRDRSFFEIGGTSLTVFAATHRLREVFGLTKEQLGAATLYTHPTLSALAAVIDRARRGEAVATADETILVSLRRGEGSGLPPLFVVSSAGGTLGAYDKVVRSLRTPRDVIGLRDPLIAGARDPREGFQRWVRRYTDAVRRRQPRGPYHLLAYSSAGAFGYEIAQQLRADGEEVALLALVDPVAMDCVSTRRFGYWALRARFQRPALRSVVRWGGLLRAAVPRLLRGRPRAAANDWAFSDSEFDAVVTWATTDRGSILRFASLLEFNTGRPFAIPEAELDAVAPAAYVDVLLARVARVDAAIDADMIRRSLVQYELQVRSQHRYQPQRYDRHVYLFVAAGPYSGLIATQLRPYVAQLTARSLSFTGLPDRMRALLEYFPEGLRAHYGCMRNDAFAEHLARELDAALALAAETRRVG